jgi:hypothetical protein
MGLDAFRNLQLSLYSLKNSVTGHFTSRGLFLPFKLSPSNTYLCQSTKLAGKKIMKKETKKQVTAPKVATVARAVKARIVAKIQSS